MFQSPLNSQFIQTQHKCKIQKHFSPTLMIDKTETHLEIPRKTCGSHKGVGTRYRYYTATTHNTQPRPLHLQATLI